MASLARRSLPAMRSLSRAMMTAPSRSPRRRQPIALVDLAAGATTQVQPTLHTANFTQLFEVRPTTTLNAFDAATLDHYLSIVRPPKRAMGGAGCAVLRRTGSQL